MLYRHVIAKLDEGAARGPQARRAREVEELRHRILDMAEEILIAEGYAGLSMRRIADAVEYAPSTIYGYFKGKQEILCAVIERTAERLIEALDAAARTPGPLSRLRMLGRSYVEFALRYPRHYEVLFMLHGPTVPEVDSPAFTSAIEHIRDAVSDGIAEGVFRRMDIDETAQAFWAACHGVASLLLSRGDRYDFVAAERLMENVLTLQLEGIRPVAFGITAPVREPRRSPSLNLPPTGGQSVGA